MLGLHGVAEHKPAENHKMLQAPVCLTYQDIARTTVAYYATLIVMFRGMTFALVGLD